MGMNFQRTRTLICWLRGHRWVDGFRLEGPPDDNDRRRTTSVVVCDFCDRVEPEKYADD